MPSKPRSSAPRGFVVPIGGAEKKKADRLILDRFVRLTGGADARIAVVPTASEQGDTGDRYRRLFEDLGAEAVEVLPIVERREAYDEGYLRVLEDVSGIFLTGGNQLRLSTILGGTPVAQAVRRLNAAGVHVGGTSAGAGTPPAPTA
jgi:cyanophycinase